MSAKGANFKTLKKYRIRLIIALVLLAAVAVSGTLLYFNANNEDALATEQNDTRTANTTDRSDTENGEDVADGQKENIENIESLDGENEGEDSTTETEDTDETPRTPSGTSSSDDDRVTGYTEEEVTETIVEYEDNYVIKDKWQQIWWEPVTVQSETAVAETVIREMSISVLKVWNDDNDRDVKRPASIKVQLVGTRGEETEVIDEKTLYPGNNWTYEWQLDLPVYADGQEIVYTVVEVPEEGTVYTSEKEEVITTNSIDVTITNTYEIETVERVVTKVWDDNDNQDGLRNDIEYITVELCQVINGEKVGLGEEYRVNLFEENDWTYRWPNLPKNEKGVEIEYAVKEITELEDYTVSYDSTINDETGAVTYTVTNTHTPEVTDIEIEKVWEDNNDQDGKRPEKIEVTLNKTVNGETTKVETKEISGEGNTWTAVWNELPVYENGNKITYTAVEANVPEGYESTADGLTITNTYTPEEIEKTVTKVWEDNNNQDGLRESVEVQLLQDGNVYGKPVKLTEGNWTYTWVELPKYHDGGKEYKYTVQEITEVEGYETIYSADTFTITNSHTPKEIEKEVTKVWEDNENQDGLREPVKVQLLQDGKVYGDPVELTEGKWTNKWTGLPKYHDGGKEYKYTVQEITEIAGYETTYSKDTFKITNKHVPNTVVVNVEKKWEDNNNQDGLRKAVEVQLYKNGDAYGDKVTLDNSNNLKTSWANLPLKENGEVIKYEVKELTEVDGYNTGIVVVPNAALSLNGNMVLDVKVTNTHTPEVTDIEIEKVWEDNNDQDGIRPEKIEVTLNKTVNGETTKVETKEISGEGNTWTASWTDLPVYENGNKITYTAVEANVPDEYVSTAEGLTITNTHSPITTEKEVTKVWEDNNNQDGLRKAVEVQLLQDGKVYGKPVELTEGNWTYKWGELPKYHDGGVEYKYTVQEITEVEGYETIYSADTFTITNSHTPEEIEKTVTKVWEDNNNQDGLRESVEVQLLQDGNAYGDPVELTEGKWTNTWTGLPKYHDGGEEYKYTVQEITEIEGYETTYSSDTFTITNKHIPNTVIINVEKKWEDNDNQDGLRKAIEVQLYQNEEAYGDAITLDDTNEWKASWVNLPERESGKNIKYEVKEVTKIDGYTVNIEELESSESNNINVVVTNTHTPEVTDIEIEKVWEDNNDQDGKRPEKIEVTLNKTVNGETTKVGTKEISGEGNTWTAVWNELPVYENGNKITYTAVEANVPEGYESTADGLTITNTYTPEVTDIEIEKVWEDNNDQDGIRPEKIEVTLNKTVNGETTKVGTKEISGEGNTWIAVWNELPVYENGNKITYTAVEANVPEGYESTADGVTITNSYTPEVIEKTVTKIWDDNNNQDGLRETVKVQLLQDGNVYGEQVELTGGKWTYTWVELPKYHDGGKEHEYTVQEITEVEGYETTYSSDTFTITNKHIPNTVIINAEKIWEDNDNQDGLRKAVEVQLYKNGDAYGDKVTLDNSNWKTSWANLPLKENGEVIKYEVKELTEVDGYNTEIVVAPNTALSLNGNMVLDVKVTNTHTPETTEIGVTKVWEDYSNKERPEKITVKLNKTVNGETTTVGTKQLSGTSDTWSDKWTDLPVYEDGARIEYSVEEIEVDGYTTDIVEDKDGNFTITNYLNKQNIKVEKHWEDKDDQDGYRPTELTINLIKNKEIYESVKLKPNAWEYEWEKLDIVDENGNKITWEVTEGEYDNDDKYTLETPEITNKDNVVTIKLTNTHITEKVPVTVEKQWFNDENYVDTTNRPEITIQLKADGEDCGDPIKLDDGNWSYTWNDLDKKANGENIKYTVEEITKLDDYTVSYETGENGELLIKNTYNKLPKEVTIVKEYTETTTTKVKKPVDVVFILDTSGSMVQNGRTRAQEMVDATNAAISTILNTTNVDGTNVGNRVGVVAFSSTGSNNNNTTHANTLLTLGTYTPNSKGEYLIKDGSALKTSANNNVRYFQGATYTQAGIKQAETLFTETTEERTPVIILLTDGEPTLTEDDYDNVSVSINRNNLQGNGSESSNAYSNGELGAPVVLSAAYYKDVIDDRYTNGTARMYTVGFGISNTNNFAKAVLDPSVMNDWTYNQKNYGRSGQIYEDLTEQNNLTKAQYEYADESFVGEDLDLTSILNEVIDAAGEPEDKSETVTYKTTEEVGLAVIQTGKIELTNIDTNGSFVITVDGTEVAGSLSDAYTKKYIYDKTEDGSTKTYLDLTKFDLVNDKVVVTYDKA